MNSPEWVREHAVALIIGWFQFVESSTPMAAIREIISDGDVSEEDARAVLAKAHRLMDSLK